MGHDTAPNTERIRRSFGAAWPLIASGALRSPIREGAAVASRPERFPVILFSHGTQKIVQDWVRRAARRAKLSDEGVHVLRHTFCSHLAMRGAPARAIQELAGHQDLTTTQRYMHLSPAAIEGAIRLLDLAEPSYRLGDILETAKERSAKASV